MLDDASPPLRLMVEEESQSGARNMAIDECLLESALSLGVHSLRIYGWDQATVSLGYFQPAEEVQTGRFKDLPSVRRLSGGGAILHHHEVTYSVVLAASHPLSSRPSDLYGRMHEAILEVLAQSGVVARLRGSDKKDGPEPFLCFSRGDRNDIVMGEMKVVGSAQRRRRGAVLQHGSLLIRHSEFATELPGILDLAPGAKLPASLREDLGACMAQRIGPVIHRGTLSDDELTRVRELMETTYLQVK